MKEGKFLSTLTLTHRRNGSMKVAEVFSYLLHDRVTTITVPVGFQTDGPSIGMLRRFGMFILHSILAGYGLYASIIHDYLYSLAGTEHGVSRERADEIYLEALAACNVGPIMSQIFYRGVRLFGRKAWSNHLKENKK